MKYHTLEVSCDPIYPSYSEDIAKVGETPKGTAYSKKITFKTSVMKICNSNLSRTICVIPLIVLLSISVPAWSKWPVEVWPETSTTSETVWPVQNAEYPKWPTSESGSFIVLRTVILHPADGRNDACISADVVSVDEEYKVEYQGHLYKITPLSGNPLYDSLVEIEERGLFVFCLKLHPYE